MKELIFLAALAASLGGCNRSPDFYFQRGNVYASSGNDAQALENYNRALLLKRNFPEALVARGVLFEHQGDRQKAGLDYRKAIELDSGYLPAYNDLAALLMDGGSYRDAVSLLSTAIDSKPDYSYGLLNRGLARYKLGDCAGATEDLSRAIQLNPKFTLAYYHRALCARNAHNFTSELSDLDAVLQLDPAAALARLERGKALFAIADYAGAAQEFDKGLQLKAQDPAFAYWKALSLFRSGDAAAAQSAALLSLKLSPGSHQAEGLLGDICASLGDAAGAREHYLRAAQFSPRYASAYRARAASLERPAPYKTRKRAKRRP